MTRFDSILAQGRRLYLHYVATDQQGVADDISLYFIRPLERLKMEDEAESNREAAEAYWRETTTGA